MPQYNQDDESFYKYAFDLFDRAGHVSAFEPEFINHSAENFVLFDCKNDLSLTKFQRGLFPSFYNVSYLFTFNGCAFYSIVLLSSKSSRSQNAHDIHTLFHPGTGKAGTVCMFKYEDEIMLSFIGFGYHCVLSDWYPIEDDYDSLLAKLDIINFSIGNGADYFSDMIYMLARKYYFLPNDPSIFDLIPANMFFESIDDDIDRDEINQLLEQEISRPWREYGDDYVDYDESALTQKNLFADLDVLLLELDTEEDEDDENLNSIFSEDMDEEDRNDEDPEDDNSENVASDEYEFDDVDPEAFRDPTVLVKWIKKHMKD